MCNGTRAGESTRLQALYRSETGEPVLLFANLDGVAYGKPIRRF